jgi:hypothetical protein
VYIFRVYDIRRDIKRVVRTNTVDEFFDKEGRSSVILQVYKDGIIVYPPCEKSFS